MRSEDVHNPTEKAMMRLMEVAAPLVATFMPVVQRVSGATHRSPLFAGGGLRVSQVSNI